MSSTEEQYQEISPIQHEMLMSSLKPEEQHKLKMIRERCTVDQEKSIKLACVEARKLFDEVAADPTLRMPGVMERLKTEAGAQIRFNILNNPNFRVADAREITEAIGMESWASRKT